MRTGPALTSLSNRAASRLFLAMVRIDEELVRQARNFVADLEEQQLGGAADFGHCGRDGVAVAAAAVLVRAGDAVGRANQGDRARGGGAVAPVDGGGEG